MLKPFARSTALLACSLLLTGCGGSDGGSSISELERLADQADAQDVVVEAEDAQADLEKAAADARAEADRLANEAPSSIDIDDFQRGQKVKGGGYLSTTIRGGIAGQQKMKLATVEHALNIYWGLEGRYPESHEEFMEKIVEFNQLELEELVEPYEYWYNAEENELMKKIKPEVIAEAEAAASAAEEAAAK